MARIIKRGKKEVIIKGPKGDDLLCTREVLNQYSYMGEEILDKCQVVLPKGEEPDPA